MPPAWEAQSLNHCTARENTPCFPIRIISSEGRGWGAALPHWSLAGRGRSSLVPLSSVPARLDSLSAPSGSGAELAAPLVQATESSLCLFIIGLSGQDILSLEADL